MPKADRTGHKSTSLLQEGVHNQPDRGPVGIGLNVKHDSYIYLCALSAMTCQCTQVRQSPTHIFLGSLATADLLLICICLPLKVGSTIAVPLSMNIKYNIFTDGKAVLLQLGVWVASVQAGSLLRDTLHHVFCYQSYSS